MAAVSGLAMDENGRFYFKLDGSGAPLEVSIDIPLEEFMGLRFDGAPWSEGDDYSVRSGSTVLSIAAERLERSEAGVHTLSARFRSETTEIVFELIKGATAPAASPSGEGAAAFPAAAMIAIIAALAALGASVAIRRSRRGGMAG
jgi:hypothetical protein